MQVLPTTYAYVFPPDTPEDLIADMNDAIVELKETGVFAALKSQYIDPPVTCPTKLAQSDLAASRVSSLACGPKL